MSGFAAQFGPALLVAALAAPLVVLAAFLMASLRGLARAITPLAAVPALTAAMLAIGGAPFGAELPALRMSLSLDQPGGLLLLVAALVWLIVSVFALMEGQGRPNADRFAVSWLLTMAGSLGMFIAEEAAFHASARLGEGFEQADRDMRQWPAASLALIVMALALTAAGWASR